MIAGAVTTAPKSESFDPATLQRLLDGRYRELREQIRDTMCRAEFERPVALPTPEYRELVFEWAKTIAREA